MRARDRRIGGRFDAVLRGADDLNDAIDMPAGVGLLQVIGLECKIDRAVAAGAGSCASCLRRFVSWGPGQGCSTLYIETVKQHRSPI
jgi:hypothetical protein